MRVSSCGGFPGGDEMPSFQVKTEAKETFIDITDQLDHAVQEAGIQEGSICLQVLHTSCGLTINEGHDPELKQDLLDALSRLVPAGGWRHDRLDGNADAHIKASLLGVTLQLQIKEGRLVLGTWQRVLLGEFDGPRVRTLSYIHHSGSENR